MESSAPTEFLYFQFLIHMRTVYFVIGRRAFAIVDGIVAGRPKGRRRAFVALAHLIFSRVQDERLNISQGRRLLFIGGSSTLFGIDAKLIGAETGVTTLNLGTHAGYSLRFHASRLRGMLREGDVVVAQFEKRGLFEIFHLRFRTATTTNLGALGQGSCLRASIFER